MPARAGPWSGCPGARIVAEKGWWTGPNPGGSHRTECAATCRVPVRWGWIPGCSSPRGHRTTPRALPGGLRPSATLKPFSRCSPHSELVGCSAQGPAIHSRPRPDGSRRHRGSRSKRSAHCSGAYRMFQSPVPRCAARSKARASRPDDWRPTQSRARRLLAITAPPAEGPNRLLRSPPHLLQPCSVILMPRQCPTLTEFASTQVTVVISRRRRS